MKKLFSDMNDSYYLYFKGIVNSILAFTLGLMGYLEAINAIVSILGGLFFLVVSFLTARKLWYEHNEKYRKIKK
jgi:uncharacterized membrane protein (UPF0136 family)